MVCIPMIPRKSWTRWEIIITTMKMPNTVTKRSSTTTLAWLKIRLKQNQSKILWTAQAFGKNSTSTVTSSLVAHAPPKWCSFQWTKFSMTTKVMAKVNVRKAWSALHAEGPGSVDDFDAVQFHSRTPSGDGNCDSVIYRWRLGGGEEGGEREVVRGRHAVTDWVKILIEYQTHKLLSEWKCSRNHANEDKDYQEATLCRIKLVRCVRLYARRKR